MLRAYLSKKLTRPLPTKDRGTLRTVADARAYMLGLSKQRELRTRWQRVAGLILEEADNSACEDLFEAFLHAESVHGNEHHLACGIRWLRPVTG
jgi:hypothetical protein